MLASNARIGGMSLLDKAGLTGFLGQGTREVRNASGMTNNGPFGADEKAPFATLSSFNEFLPDSITGKLVIHSAIRACIERIISRALPAEFKGETGSTTEKLKNPQGKNTKTAFLRQILEQLLLTGNALVYRAKNNRHYVGITKGSSYDERHRVWHIQTSVYERKLMPLRAGDEMKVAHIYLGYKYGREHHFVQSPIQSIVQALMLHDSTRMLLTDYGRQGHKIGGVVAGTKDHAPRNPEKYVTDLEDIRDQLNESVEQFRIVSGPVGMEFRPGTSDSNAPSIEGAEMALQEIARTFGVPMEMIQSRKERTDYSNVDDHLMSDAVFPVLDMVCEGLSRHFNEEVCIEPFSAARAVMGNYAKNIIAMAQSDCFKRNEVRHAQRMPPLSKEDGGEEFPQSAGAGYSSEAQSDNGRPKEGTAGASGTQKRS